MSETISNLPSIAGPPYLADVLPITHGYTSPGSGTTYAYSIAKLLAASGLIYAGDPAYNGGVLADGSTDDTTAWTQALAAAFNSSTWVVPPLGVSIVSSITVPNGVGILARTPGSLSNTQGFEAGGCVIKGTSVSAPTISLGSWCALNGVQVNGNSSQPCVNASAGYVDIANTTCFGGSVGIGFALTGGASRLLACRIHDCGTAGVQNAIDTDILGCRVTNCGNGVMLAPGANGVSIIGGKIELCTNGVSADGTGGVLNNVVISGVRITDSNANAVLLRGVTTASVTGNVFSRNGQGQGGSPGGAGDAHVYLQNNLGVVVSGNTSRAGAVGSYNGPYWAIFDGGGNVNCLINTNGLAYHNNSATLGGASFGPINVTSTFNLASALNTSYWQ